LPRARFAFARAQMQWGAARAYAYETGAKLWNEMTSKSGPSLKTRLDVALARIHAFRMAYDVARLMVDTVGPSAIVQSSPLDGLFRDAITMNQHLGFNDGIVEQLGVMMFGDEPTLSFA
jgi:alkylation response protein AidB-like acyl-CoA dehydrogenase